jgi:transcriptional regulator with XRE-family HTH domain
LGNSETVEVPEVAELPSIGAEPVDLHVGARIRQLREARNLSARDLAEAASVSPSYLSRLENAKVSPTVATLSRIVQAMGESISSLFGEASGGGPVVRAADRLLLRSRGVDDYRVTPGWTTRLEVLETIVNGGQGSGPAPHSHPGDEECVLVLDGQLDIWIDEVQHRLGRGDSATFACKSSHKWRNPTAEPCRVLWMITPATY